MSANSDYDQKPLISSEFCPEFRVPTDSSFISNFEALINNKNTIVQAYNNAYLSNVYMSLNEINPIYPSKTDLSYQNPLVISPNRMFEYYNLIKRKVVSYSGGLMYPWFFEGDVPIFRANYSDLDNRNFYLSGLDRYRLRRIIGRIEGLKNMYNRWTRSICFSDNLRIKTSNDIRDFLILRDSECENGSFSVSNSSVKICLEDAFKKWNRLNYNVYKNHKKEIKNHMIGLCSSSGYSLSFCEEEFERKEVNEEVYEYYLFYKQLVYKNKYLNLFKIDQHQSSSFSCLQERDFRKVIIPVYFSDNDLDYEQILRKISKRFYSKKEKVKVVFLKKTNLSSDSIHVKFSKDIISHVKHSESRVVYLNSDLKDRHILFQNTLAHELGHILGLKDCYVEFLNNNDEYIYYRIDSNNLMCGLDSWSNISDHSMKLIKDKNCAH